MKLVCIFSFFLLLSGLSICASQPNQFNHSWLALTWPPSFCQLKNCTEKPIAAFTIHGLWPTNGAGVILNETVQKNANMKWLSNKSLPLVQNLASYWPSFTSSNEKFWKYEWNKHGSTQGLLKPEEYFQRALTLGIKSRSILTVLNSLGVVPTKEKGYPISEFVSAIKNVIGTDQVMLVCVRHLVSEVRVCVNRNATEFIPCNPEEMKKACQTKFFPPA